MTPTRGADARDDAMATIEARYRALEAKMRTVHDAKMHLARAAVKSLARGDGDGDEAQRAEADAHIAGLERSLDEALTALAKEKAEDIQVIENGRKMERDAAEVTRRYVEEERARALAARATPAPEVLRTQINSEEVEVYDEADDYRSRSPEGTSPRAAEEAVEAEPTVKSSGSGLMSAARSILQTKKVTGQETMVEPAIVDIVADTGRVGRKKVNMAALAPKPAAEPRASVSALAPTPIATKAPATATAPVAIAGEDPHDAMVQRLRSTKIESSSVKALDDVPAAGPAARRHVIGADAPSKNVDLPSQPQQHSVLQVAPRLDITRPRGLGAAVKDILENPPPTRLRDIIESAFGAPRSRDDVGDPPQTVFAHNTDAFASESIARRKFVPVPAAPVRLEPNPYIMSQEDLKLSQARRRVGFEENVPHPNGAYATPAQPQRTHTGSQMMEVVGSTGPPSRISSPAPAPQTSNQLASTRSDVKARTDDGEADYDDADDVDSDANENASFPPVVLKPKFPRVLVPPQRFKVTEMRNLFSFARHGRYAQMKDLLTKGVPIDARDEHGNSALITACQNGQGRLVKLLIRSGADPNIQNKRGNTALHFTVLFKFDVIADFIIKHGARTDIRNFDGLTCYEFIG